MTMWRIFVPSSPYDLFPEKNIPKAVKVEIHFSTGRSKCPFWYQKIENIQESRMVFLVCLKSIQRCPKILKTYENNVWE
jgi:hypothetical protein